eukprot:TRINITY_DN1445_c0_g1_i1.p1 TRINITY_DN1445_c0_g1~~TRINITY_DN1445_c0_g1_i1.p1  ORF type:complete len:515 (+),score=145.97 TRINITY_DN1445_c0_g1_i1:114-1658(+)
MVVLSAAILSKAGKSIVSRQFVEISRVRIEGLLAAFPKLMGSEKQHTFVETENVRYVYQPVETLYLLLITTKTSNILEDLETLHLLAKLIPEYTQSLTEEDIYKNMFEILFAFDEVITMGYKEKSTISMIKTFTEMDSHEERVQQMIEKNKEKELSKLRIAKEKEIKKARMEREKSGMSNTSGFGSEKPGASPTVVPIEPSFSPQPTYTAPSRESAAPSQSAGKGGMKLSMGAKPKGFIQALKEEGEYVEEDVPAAPVKGSSSAAAASSAPSASAIQITLEEKISVTVNNDGGVQDMDVKGELIAKSSDPNQSRFRIALQQGNVKNYMMKTHPNINKTAFQEDGTIVLKDPSRPYPTNTPVGVLKWRFQSKDEADVPLTVNCWPSVGSKGTDCNVEYELRNTKLELSNVVISIPLAGATDPPVVADVTGNYNYDSRNRVLLWQLDLVDESNSSGSIEFSIKGVQPKSFFPISVRFTSRTTMCDLQVAGVFSLDTEAPLPFGLETSFAPESYSIV